MSEDDGSNFTDDQKAVLSDVIYGNAAANDDVAVLDTSAGTAGVHTNTHSLSVHT